MKRIRVILILSIISIIIITSLVHLDIIAFAVLLEGAVLGAIVSIVISAPLEYFTYKNEQKDKLNKYFWEGVAKYQSSLEEVHLYARDFYDFELIIFEKYNIPKESGNWQDYEVAFIENRHILENSVEKYCDVINQSALKNSSSVLFLSHLLTTIDRKTIFGSKSKVYEKCYEAYHIIENINWSLIDAQNTIANIADTGNIKEKCEKLIVLRWLSNLLYVDYDRHITDIEEFEDNERQGKAEQDLNLAVYEIMKML